MRLLRLRLYTQPENEETSKCSSDIPGCMTMPNEQDSQLQQASSLHQNSAFSTSSYTSNSAMTTAHLDATENNAPLSPASQTHVVNGQIIGGIIVIFIILAALSTAGCYVIFGPRGEQCCCTRRRRARDEKRQLEEAWASAKSVPTLAEPITDTKYIEAV